VVSRWRCRGALGDVGGCREDGHEGGRLVGNGNQVGVLSGIGGRLVGNRNRPSWGGPAGAGMIG
jgi:hypothetical protein